MIKKTILFLLISTLFTVKPVFANTTNSNSVASNNIASNNGVFSTEKINYGYKITEYEYFLNQKEILPKQTISNLSLSDKHLFEIYTDDKQTVFSTNFLFGTNQYITIEASEKWDKSIYYHTYILGGSWIGAGVDCFLNRYLWFEGGMSFAYWYDEKITNDFFIVASYIGIGYYFIGDKSKDMRFGLGARFKVPDVLPYENWEQVITNYYDSTNDVPPHELRNSHILGELYAIYEWKSLYLSLAIQFDFYSPKFRLMPYIGVKF